jgi:hypothetical protein
MRVWGMVGLLALGYPACEWVGLDGCMSWLSNGNVPSEGELLGSVLVLGARVAQCVGAPMLALVYIGWLATVRLRRP